LIDTAFITRETRGHQPKSAMPASSAHTPCWISGSPGDIVVGCNSGGAGDCHDDVIAGCYIA
jgi:hypothetical protein